MLGRVGVAHYASPRSYAVDSFAMTGPDAARSDDIRRPFARGRPVEAGAAARATILESAPDFGDRFGAEADALGWIASQRLACTHSTARCTLTGAAR